MSIAAPQPIVVRLYDPIELVFFDGDLMLAPNTTTAAPPCFQCEMASHLPPAKLGWVSMNGAESLISICGACAFGTEEEIKARVVAKVSGSPPATAIAAE